MILTKSFRISFKIVALGAFGPYGYETVCSGDKTLVLNGSSGQVTVSDTLTTSMNPGTVSFDLTYPPYYGSAGLFYGMPFAQFQASIVRPASAPSNLQATSPSDTENDLSWNAVNDGTGNPVSNYNVYRSTNDTDPKPWTLVGSSPTPTYQDTGLQPNTQYFYYVTAVDQWGQESAPSNVVNSTTDSDTVTALISATGPVAAVPVDTGNIVLASAATPAASPSGGLKRRPLTPVTDGMNISGTNSELCIVATAKIGTTGIIPPTSISVQIGGVQVGTLPGPSIDIVFDTTHFGPGGTAPGRNLVEIDEETTYADGTTSQKHWKVYAFNTAYVLGNNTYPEGNSAQVHNSAALVDMNHYVASGGQDPKEAILTFLPAATVFYIDTHDSPGQFGDCFRNPSTNAGQVIVASDVSSALTSKNDLLTPPYNFVFIDGCQTATDTTLADAFGVTGWQDAAYLGFLTNVPIANSNKCLSQIRLYLEPAIRRARSEAAGSKSGVSKYSLFQP